MEDGTAGIDSIIDEFDRPDGPVTAPWVDACDVDGPTYWDRTVVEHGHLALRGRVLNTWPDERSRRFLVGHYHIFRDTPRSDDFEVSVLWTFNGYGLCSQVSPAAFVDLDASDPTKIGICPVWDIGLRATYVQNTFRIEPISDVLDSSYYSYVEGTSNTRPPLVGSGAPNWITLKVRSGSMRSYWNGKALHPPVEVPKWARGRTQCGIHVVAIEPRTPDVHWPAYVSKFRWRPFAGNL